MLTNIDNKLDGIQVSLNNLVNLIKDESVRDRVRKRNEVYNAMISTVRPLINTPRKYAEDGDTLKITKSIIAWGESTICGNPGYISPNKMRAKNETWEKCRECTMSMKEAQTILKFYGYNKSMRDILIDGGCEIPNGANGCFITNDGTIATFRSETPLAGYRRTIYDLKAVNIPLSTTLSENDRGNMDRTSNIATFVRMIINGQYRYEVNRMPGSPDLYRAVIIRRN